MKYTEVNQKELEEILAAVKPSLKPSQHKVLENAVKMLFWLQIIVKEKSISITRLARMLFGKKTECLKNLKEQAKTATTSSSSNNEPTESHPNNSSEQVLDESAKDDQNNAAPFNSEGNASKDTPQTQEKKKNHGRRPLSDYNVSKIVYIPHKCLNVGQKCPLCAKGRLYDIDPETILLICGQPPLTGEAYSAQGLRCHLCQHVFRAAFPKEVASQSKADMSARTVICLAKYQLGTPLYRLETWQKLMRLPISDSEMWEWTESVALVLFPVHQALLNIAAKGNVIHHDDTAARILDLMEENKQAALAKKSPDKTEQKAAEKQRKGIYTTALLSKIEGLQVAVYITGRKNSGENLDELLDRRPNDLTPPIQACDASSNNGLEQHKSHVAKCFNHARHNFCELVEAWPNEALAVVEMCNAVFMNDRKTKEMKPDERLQFHQKHSTSILNKLKSYCKSLVDEKKVEPNSSFGKAINYFNNHWEGLTMILRDGNAPLSNNDCERAIKSSVLIRKNSYFYKSCWGAFVGDTLLSIIKTCGLNGINPYDYLMAVQANSETVAKNPNNWLPWSYTQNVGAPFVNAQHIPVEEIYRSAGPPISVTRGPQPCLEDNKRTLRARTRDFFRQLYPEKWQKLSQAHPLYA